MDRGEVSPLPLFLKQRLGNAPHRSYNDWFWEKAGKIAVRIYDKKLKEELIKEVSWAKRVKVL